MADPTESDIIQRESGGKPYVGFGGVDLSNAPLNQHGFPIWAGNMGPAGISHAAGLYQFEPKTWASYAAPLGIKDFSPESQKKVYDAARAAEGARPWAASEPKMQKEGYYGGQMHLNIFAPHPRQNPNAMLDGLLAMAAAQSSSPESAAAPSADPNTLLDKLLGSAQKPETAKPQETPPQPAPAIQQPPGAPAAPNLLAQAEPLAAQPMQQVGQPEEGPGSEGSFFTPQQVYDRNKGYAKPGPYWTTLDPGQEQQFRQWVQQNKVRFNPNEIRPDYDMRGFWQAMQRGDPRARRAIDPNDIDKATGKPRVHESDYWKTPYDLTFSRQSQWATKGAPEWNDKEQLVLPNGTVIYDDRNRGSYIGKPSGGIMAPNTLLDHLLSATPGLRFAKGAAEGLLGEPRPGAPATFNAAVQRTPEDIGRSVGGMVLSPMQLAARGGEAATGEGPPVTPNEALNMAMMAGTGSIGTGGFGAGPRLPEGMAPIEKGLGRRAADGVQAIFSPTTIDASSLSAEATIRENQGQARREMARAEAHFNNAERKLVSRRIPEYGKWLAGGRNPAEKPELQRFVDYIEGVGGPDFDRELMPIAEKIKRIYTHYRKAIEADPRLENANFVEDYFQHMWQEKAKARTIFGAGSGGRTGSGRSLRKREIPTVSAGIQAGLTPVYLDPIANTLAYVSNMSKYLAHNRIFRSAEDAGYIEFHPIGQQPEGMAPLNGRLAQRVFPGKGDEPVIMQAFAPAPFARVYNTSIAPSLAARMDEWGNIYRAALHGKNAITTAVLGLPFFHAIAMSVESVASGLATATNMAARGQVEEAAKLATMAIMPGVKQARDVLGVGRRMQRQYLGLDDYGPDYEKIADLLARSGGRGVSRGTEWKFSGAQNFVTAFKRGQLKLSFTEPFRGKGAGGKALAAASLIPREMARTMETVMAPLFEHAIPRLKDAAFFDEMRSWLQANPDASHAGQLTRARQVWDTIDDRFGEVVMENIFWSRALKDVLNIALTSQGWELGTIRSYGGSALDVAAGGPRAINAAGVASRGGRWSPRTSYMVGLTGATVIMSSLYQYLKTGTLPSSVGEFMGAPWGGGNTPEGAREHAWLPGYNPKEPAQFAHAPFQYFLNKLSPFGQLGGSMMSGKDYAGRDIAPEPALTPQWFKDWSKFVLQSFTPIPVRQQQKLEGSNIGTAERWMGIRPAPGWYDDPARSRAIEDMHNLSQKAQQAASAYTQARRQGQDRGTIRDLLIKRQEAYRALRMKEKVMRGKFRIQPPVSYQMAPGQP